MPAGELLTVPDPLRVTVNANGVAANVAVTLRVALIVTTHVPVPVQSPLHPLNVYPLAGVAVRVTAVALL
jgi:hypothetical protein